MTDEQKVQAVEMTYKLARDAGWVQFVGLHPDYVKAELFGKERQFRAINKLTKDKNKMMIVKGLKFKDLTTDQWMQLQDNNFSQLPAEEGEEQPASKNNTQNKAKNQTQTDDENPALDYLMNTQED
jgi:hypothetical protein